MPKTAAPEPHLPRPRSVPLPPPRSLTSSRVPILQATRSAPNRLWEERTRPCALPKALGDMPDLAATRIRGSIDAVTVDACAPGSPDTRGVGLRSGGSGALPPCKAGSPLQTDSSPPPDTHCAQTVFVSAGGHPLANKTAISRRGETTPRGAGIPGAHAPPIPTSIQPRPLFLGNQECPLSSPSSGLAAALPGNTLESSTAVDTFK